MAANMGRPKPSDPIAHRLTLRLSIRCLCGRARVIVVGELAAQHGVPGDATIWQMLGRLRCVVCGGQEMGVSER
jgi:hypothetical protein